MEIEDMTLDYYLGQLQEKEEPVNEIDPLTTTAAVGTLYTISMIIQFLLAASSYRKAFKVDALLSKRVNNIIPGGSKWVVHKYADTTPNAFCIGGKDIYIATGLMKILNSREIDAVMLHEAWHNKDLHVWKGVAAQSTFMYAAVYICMTLFATSGVFALGFIVAYIFRHSMELSYARIVGRRHEIAADEYAVKFGYSKEMISALTKLEKWVGKKRRSEKCGKMCQMERKISEAMDEHPPTKTRVETILKKAKEMDRAMKSGFKAIHKFVAGVFKYNG